VIPRRRCSAGILFCRRPNCGLPASTGAPASPSPTPVPAFVRDVRAAAAPAVHDLTGAEPLVLHEDRFFDSRPGRAARRPGALRGDARPAARLPARPRRAGAARRDAAVPGADRAPLIPDHYIFRMLYSQGIRLEALGIPTRDGTPVEATRASSGSASRSTTTCSAARRRARLARPRAARGVRRAREALGRHGAAIYDQIAERLQSPEFRPRALFERFNIEVLATTDAASDTLAHHQAIRDSGWSGRVIPTFRPDAVLRHRGARMARRSSPQLERAHGAPIATTRAPSSRRSPSAARSSGRSARRPPTTRWWSRTRRA
jgi:glucuronate isomerase